jgi:4-amino-4-deoxy-L-arabinose transferase-like glycosyltransferase
LVLSIIFVPPVHRLFFDEDIYISIARNLTHSPVNQLTVIGGPDDVQVSSYYKEPAGWPVLLSLAFRITTPSEAVAFFFARLLFAAAIAAVFQLAQETLKQRSQAFIAAILFAATPICFWSSASAGTDICAALMTVLGMWGLVSGNGALASGGLALAAQTRMELLILMPLVWLSHRISLRWKTAAAVMVALETVHIAWVMSLSSSFERAEQITVTFSPQYIATNLKANLAYFINPFAFFSLVTLLAAIAVWQRWRRGNPDTWLLAAPVFALFSVYCFFYAGRFDLNTRYSIQLLAPMTVLAASQLKRLRILLLASIVLPYTQNHENAFYAQVFGVDHQLSTEFAARMKPDDVIVSGQPEMFLNQGRHVMNAAFVAEHKNSVIDEIRRRTLWYHSGVRANGANGPDAKIDQWVKSNFQLQPVESQEINGVQVVFYRMSPDE